MAASEWVTLVAGGAGGAFLTAVYNTASTRATWRREDRRRFTTTKREAYARFLAVFNDYIQHKQADDDDGTERGDALTDAIRVNQLLMVVSGEVRLIGGLRVRLAVKNLVHAGLSGEGLEPYMAEFFRAAREDLGIEAQEQTGE